MTKPGRNELCHCGSGKKYKKCCLAKDDIESRAEQAIAEAERQKKAAAEQELPEEDAIEPGSKPIGKSRSLLDGKGGAWGKDDRAGRYGASAGRRGGSGHR